jgi:hypothetical protein
MAINIDVQPIPNQSFQLLVEQDLYLISIKTVDSQAYVSIQRNNVVLISNIKAMPNKPILESQYLYAEHGNFVFYQLDDDEYPYYRFFGISSFFKYITKSEVLNAF